MDNGAVELSAPEVSETPERLELSLIRKVSPDGWYQPEDENRAFKSGRWVPTVPNSFGLPAGESCPGKTKFCESCYADNISGRKNVLTKLNNNFELLNQCDGPGDMAELLIDAVERYEEAAVKKGTRPEDMQFRHHWSGDFYSEEYAVAWGMTMERFKHIRFWAYTRSFGEPIDVVPILEHVPNLTLYLSVDSGNIDMARKHPDVPRAYCASDVVSAEMLAKSEGRTARVCPENIGRMPAMKDGRGACLDCRWCPDSKTDIIFTTTHSYGHPQLPFDAAEEPIRSVPVKLKKRSVISGTRMSEASRNDGSTE